MENSYELEFYKKHVYAKEWTGPYTEIIREREFIKAEEVAVKKLAVIKINSVASVRIVAPRIRMLPKGPWFSLEDLF